MLYDVLRSVTIKVYISTHFVEVILYRPNRFVAGCDVIFTVWGSGSYKHALIILVA